MQTIQQKQAKKIAKEIKHQSLSSKIDKFRLSVLSTVSILRNCYFFIVASFLNMIYPIIACIILSCIPQLGLQTILGVGRTAYFTIAFCQMCITFALSINFLYMKYFLPYKMLDAKKRNSYAISNAIAYTTFISFFLIIIYIGASYLYMYYSTYLPNTYIAFTEGMNYIYSSSFYILILCFMDILLLYIYTIKKNASIYFLFTFYTLVYVSIYLLGVKANLQGVGCGLSLTISCIITIILMIFYIFFYGPIKITFKLDNFFNRIRHIKGLIQEAITGMCINLFRGIGLLIISFTVFNYASNDIVPMAYNLAIIFLLNYMYIIAFFGIGLSDTIKYYYVYYPIKDKTKRTAPFFTMIVLNIILASIICYICSIATLPLATLYAQNNSYLYPLEAPQFPKDMPTIVSKNLPPTQFPLVPNDFYNPHVSLSVVIKNYLNELINNPTSNPQLIAWMNWFRTNPQSLNTWILNHPVVFFDWLRQYEYYANCNPHVVEAFINLRTQKQINEPNQFELLMPELKYNSKSMIYLGVFGITYSMYYIFSAAKVGLSDEQMPIIIIVLGSFCLITFVLAFGASFTILLSNWKQNPFQNLDAFTFPLMLAGMVLFIIAFFEFIIVVLIIKRHTKKKVKEEHIKHINIVQDSIVL